MGQRAKVSDAALRWTAFASQKGQHCCGQMRLSNNHYVLCRAPQKSHTAIPMCPSHSLLTSFVTVPITLFPCTTSVAYLALLAFSFLFPNHGCPHGHLYPTCLLQQLGGCPALSICLSVSHNLPGLPALHLAFLIVPFISISMMPGGYWAHIIGCFVNNANKKHSGPKGSISGM